MTAGLCRYSVASALTVCLAFGACAYGQEISFVGVESGGGTGLIGATDAGCTVAGAPALRVCRALGMSPDCGGQFLPGSATWAERVGTLPIDRFFSRLSAETCSGTR